MQSGLKSEPVKLLLAIEPCGRLFVVLLFGAAPADPPSLPRGVNELTNADTLHRLSGLDEGQLKAVCRRVQSFNPEIATPWSSDEVAALIAKGRELHERR